MITLHLAEKEAHVLLSLIHVAVQAKGLDAAEAGVLFARRIQEAMKAAPAPDGAPKETPVVTAEKAA